jgi:hypothetical protein
LPDIENDNDNDDYIHNCPVCNEKIKSMNISENASNKLDSKHIENILTESENWVIQYCEYFINIQLDSLASTSF